MLLLLLLWCHFRAAIHLFHFELIDFADWVINKYSI